MELVSEGEQARRYKGDGGRNHSTNIRDDLYLLVMNDSDLETNADRRQNEAKGNKKDPSYMKKPTFNTRVNMILDNYYNMKYGDKLDEKFDNIINEIY